MTNCSITSDNVNQPFNNKAYYVPDTHTHTVYLTSLLAGNCLVVVYIHKSQSAFYRTVIIISILFMGKWRSATQL